MSSSATKVQLWDDDSNTSYSLRGSSQSTSIVSRSNTYGTTSSLLFPANPARKGFNIQNQSDTATIYISGANPTTADFNSLKIPPGGYFECPSTVAFVSAVYVISTQASTPVYAREW